MSAFYKHLFCGFGMTAGYTSLVLITVFHIIAETELYVVKWWLDYIYIFLHGRQNNVKTHCKTQSENEQYCRYTLRKRILPLQK